MSDLIRPIAVEVFHKKQKHQSSGDTSGSAGGS